MKAYPAIPNSKGQAFTEFDAYVFDKLDGQNFRSEWSKKRGWYKFGSRTQMVDSNDLMFGAAVRQFQETLAEDLTKIALKERASQMVVFAEWHGPGSFAGQHVPGETMRLSVIEATVDQRGWVGPQRFLEMFEGKVDTASYLGRHKWTRGFVQEVRNGQIPCTFEGVVGKSLQGPRLIMAKAKTEEWYKKLYEIYDLETAKKLAES